MNNSTILILCVLFCLTGCDTFCKAEVYEEIEITNETGAEFEVEVCKSAFRSSKETARIPASANGDTTIEKREVSYIRGGWRAFCDVKDGDSFKVEISLTSTHFDQVKLCYKNVAGVRSDFIFIEVSQPCPETHTEQAEPEDDCLQI